MEPHDASTEVGAPAPRLRSPDRSQVDPNPKCIDELIPPDHEARLVWALVENLDFTPLYARIKAVEGHAGRSATDPRILVALWVYAILEGVSKARELWRRCYDCDPYKWLRGGVDVNYHTLSDFRIQHSEWLKGQVVAILAAMRAENLIDMEVLGQDGMRVRASAGSDSFKRQAKLQELMEEAEQQWDRLEQEFEEETKLSAREKAAQERAARERLERLKQAQEEVEKVAQAREKRKKGDGASARASTSDPEARRMKMGDGGTRPAYNVEFTTDLNSLVIVGFDVTNAGSDAGQMEPMVEKIEAEQGPLPAGTEYYVDGGFATKDDVESVGQRGVIVYAPVKDVEKQRQQGKDPYAPKRGDSPEVTAWRRRMGTEEGREKYKQRAKCEWSNAECRNRGLQQFVVRGLEKVRTVVLWYVLAHNLFRMVALRAEKSLVGT
jgi:transposase